MKAARQFHLPEEMERKSRRAIKLEWLTIAFLLTIITLMYFTLGSSQAMRTAWIEDILSLIPPIAFLISTRVAAKAENNRHPYGYHNAVRIAFLSASLALLVMGLNLLVESVHKLLIAEHPTIGSMELFGHTVWQGWLMIPTLIYSAIPPVILGHMKKPLAEDLHDKTLFADADMNKADWMTALAAILGIGGISLGYWWADAAAATFISFEIVRDGYKNTKTVMGDLLDRRPLDVAHRNEVPLPESLCKKLESYPWIRDAEVRLREDGHVFFGECFVIVDEVEGLAEKLAEAERTLYAEDWRIKDLVINPRKSFER